MQPSYLASGIIIAFLVGFSSADSPPLVTNNTALQYLQNKTDEKKPDGAVEIQRHIKNAWQNDPILSRIEAFQNLSNQLAPQPGSKRARILLKRLHRHHRNHKRRRGQKRVVLPFGKKDRKLHRNTSKNAHVTKRTKYLDISLKLAKQDEGAKDEEKPEYQVNLVPKAPEHETSQSRQPFVPLEHHFTQIIPGTDHPHPFHFQPFYPGLQPAAAPVAAPAPEMPTCGNTICNIAPPPAPVQPVVEPVHTEVHHEEVHTPIHVAAPVAVEHHETGELQDEVNKLMRESEALKMTAARYESKAKELANEAEMLHQETVSTDGHMGQMEGVRADHTPIEVHDHHEMHDHHQPVAVMHTPVQTPMCGEKQSAHIQVQADYPVYHIPCKMEEPVVDYHRPDPPPEGVNPYEILTSDMLNEENYKPQIHHQRHKILPKSWRNKKRKRSKGKKGHSYVMTIRYGK